MDIKELQSFKLGDAVKFHDQLNPKLFVGNRLDPAVKKQLIEIAKDFLQELGVEDIKVKDITLSGSNAAYSYTPHSDLDLHVLIDYNQFPNNPVYKELFMAKKNLYNDSHDITIRGIPVELYAQDSNEPFVSLGQYSILNDKWIQIPSKRRANFDQNATKSKFGKLQDFVLRALKEKNVSKVKQALDIIKRYRKAGLTKGGEFSPENLAYKALRNQGAIQKLFDLRDKLHSKHLSIENMYANINEATDKPIIYFDMDGVLADFNGGYEKLFGKQPGDSARDDPNVGKLVGSDFFSKLDKLPYADELIKTAVKLFGGYSICSSPLRGDHKNSELNKRLWIQQHLDPQPDNIVITGKKDSYAKGKNVLIDDKPKNIIPWRDRGGIGILYNAYTDDPNTVIQKLKQIAGVVDEDIPVTPGPTQKQRTAAISKTQPKLGSGYFGKVYDQPEGELGIGTAKKISRFDQDKPTLDGYYAYINRLMSLKDQNDNPYLPQVYNANVVKPKRGAPYFELDMEKLTPWQDLEEDELLTMFSKALDVEINSLEQFRQLVGRKSIPYKDIIMTELLRYMTKTLSDPNYKDIKGNSIKDPQLIEAINIIRYLEKTGYGEDLHAGNIMVRRTKYGPQLVLTDPLSFGSQAKMDKVEQGKIRINTIGVTVPPDYFVYVYDKFNNNAVEIVKMYGSSEEIKKEVRQQYDPYWYDVEIIANDRKLDNPAQPPKPRKSTGNDWVPVTKTTQKQARNKQHSPKKYVVYDQPHDAPPWKTKKMLGDVVATSENEALRLAREKFQNVPPHKISVMIDLLGTDFDKKLDESNISNSNDYGSIEGYVVDTSKPNLANYLSSHKADPNLAQALSKNFNKIAIIKNFYVDEEHRSKGIGRQIFDRAIDDAYENGADAILLISDTSEQNQFDLTNWYKNYGFETIGMASGYPIMLLQEPLNEEDDYSIEAREIDKKLKAAGYKKIGAGAEAAVYIRDQGSVIKILMPDLEDMKDLNKDFYNAEKTFIKFYNFVKQNKGNPFLPKFIPIQGKDYARFKIGDRTFLQISMEQLYPYKKNSLEEAIIWAFSEFAASQTPWSEVEDHMGDPETFEYFGDNPQQYYFKAKHTAPMKFAKAWQTIAMTDKNKLNYYHLLYETMAALYKYGRKNNIGWDLHTENVMRRKDGTLVITDPFYGFINNKLNEVKALEDYDPNGPPPGPEFKPTMPAGTVRVDVSDVYDWYKLGQHISNMKGLGKHDFGQGPPSTILSFGDEDTEHEYIQDLEKTGLTTTDIDPIDPNQPKGMKRQKTDPTYNVNEAFDNPYKLKWYPGDWDEVTAYADIPDGDLTIIFNNDENEEGEEAWSVEFYRNNSQEITGEGDAQRIFATVLSAIQTFIKKYKPNRVIFSASKEVEPGQKIQSRANLYDRLVQRYARAMGYKAFRADAGNKVHYELSKIKKSVSEASGYIPSEKEKNDPRFKTALTVDVKPDSIKKNAKSFGFKVSRAGIPPLLRP
jgi:ribosomal protein S18 acetylase RimI-like enzyme